MESNEIPDEISNEILNEIVNQIPMEILGKIEIPTKFNERRRLFINQLG